MYETSKSTKRLGESSYLKRKRRSAFQKLNYLETNGTLRRQCTFVFLLNSPFFPLFHAWPRFRLFPEVFNPRWMRRCFAYPRSWWSFGNSTEGTAIIRGASKAAAAAAAALELIFKQRLKSANVVSAVKTTLLRAPPGRGEINPIPSTFEINWSRVSRSVCCVSTWPTRNGEIARDGEEKRNIRWNLLHVRFSAFNSRS